MISGVTVRVWRIRVCETLIVLNWSKFLWMLIHNRKLGRFSFIGYMRRGKTLALYHAPDQMKLWSKEEPRSHVCWNYIEWFYSKIDGWYIREWERKRNSCHDRGAHQAEFVLYLALSRKLYLLVSSYCIVRYTYQFGKRSRQRVVNHLFNQNP